MSNNSINFNYEYSTLYVNNDIDEICNIKLNLHVNLMQEYEMRCNKCNKLIDYTYNNGDANKVYTCEECKDFLQKKCIECGENIFCSGDCCKECIDAGYNIEEIDYP